MLAEGVVVAETIIRVEQEVQVAVDKEMLAPEQIRLAHPD
jgi:hypothetical protein